MSLQWTFVDIMNNFKALIIVSHRDSLMSMFELWREERHSIAFHTEKRKVKLKSKYQDVEKTNNHLSIECRLQIV